MYGPGSLAGEVQQEKYGQEQTDNDDAARNSHCQGYDEVVGVLLAAFGR